MLIGPDGESAGKLSRKREAQYRAWRQSLPDSDFQVIEREIATYCGKHNKATVRYFAAGEWKGTPWEPLLVACADDADAAAKFLGQILWRYLDANEQVWMFYRPARIDDEPVAMEYRKHCEQ